jgi:hypothetical protein
MANSFATIPSSLKVHRLTPCAPLWEDGKFYLECLNELIEFSQELGDFSSIISSCKEPMEDTA